MQDFIEYREQEQARIRERRERAYALFCRMRPWIRREGWLPTVNVRNVQVAVK